MGLQQLAYGHFLPMEIVSCLQPTGGQLRSGEAVAASGRNMLRIGPICRNPILTADVADRFVMWLRLPGLPPSGTTSFPRRFVTIYCIGLFTRRLLACISIDHAIPIIQRAHREPRHARACQYLQGEIHDRRQWPMTLPPRRTSPASSLETLGLLRTRHISPPGHSC